LLWAVVAAAVVVAMLTTGTADWDPGVIAMLLAFSLVSDLQAAGIRAQKLKVSGSFLAIVVAMVLLGGPPAALIGVVTILVGWLKWREAPHYLLINVATYATFPLAGGLLFDAIRDSQGLDSGDTAFPMLVFGLFAFALLINFGMTAGYVAYVERGSLIASVRRSFVPLLPSEMVAAIMAIGISEVALEWGLPALALFGILLLAFQHLLSALLVSEERAEDLQRRTEQLASLQLGLLSAMLRTLDLRDRMTARHSAAVARYAREIAKAAGLSEADQELAHTAGLLHDIGKVVFPDSILKGDTKLSDDEWQLVKMHPYHGAQVLSQVEGYGPIADIVLAHHERIDGRGYPQGLVGEDIPVIARILSVADTYDVMTARDSYRTPVTSAAAIEELRRVKSAQLDPRLVETFIGILSTKDLRYRHGEDADFETELALERRVLEYAGPAGS
jgi:putative nucleotidyltransferase with HDIG domain